MVESDDLHFKDAAKLLAEGNLVDAEKLCSEGLYASPRSGDGWHILGRIFEAQGKILDAVLAYRRALGYSKGDKDVNNSLQLLADEEMKRLEEQLLICSAIVQTWVEAINNHEIKRGIFKGIRLHPDTMLTRQASFGDLAKMVGSFDQEIHPWLDELPDYSFIVVNSSVEGLMPIGLKKLYPRAVVYSVNFASKEQMFIKVNAALNGVNLIYLDQYPSCIYSDFSNGLIYINDYKGYEELQFEGNVIIEVQDWIDRDLPSKLHAHYAATHDVELIYSGARNPNEWDILSGFPDFIRWLPAIEFQPEARMWIKATVRNA